MSPSMSEVVDDPTVIDSDKDGVSVDRWQKYDNDRLYINGVKKDVYIDLKEERVRAMGKFEMDRDGELVTVRRIGSVEWEVVISLTGDQEDIDDELAEGKTNEETLLDVEVDDIVEQIEGPKKGSRYRVTDVEMHAWNDEGVPFRVHVVPVDDAPHRDMISVNNGYLFKIVNEDDDQELATDGGQDEFSGSEALDIMDEFDTERERLETLGEEIIERDPVTETDVFGVDVGDRFEQRLHVYYRPPDRGDGTPSWTVPESLLTWADSHGLILRDIMILEDVDVMKAEFALREETPHDPHQVVLKKFSELFEDELSAAQALDYWACDVAGVAQKGWGDTRGVNRQTVNDRVTEVRAKRTTDAMSDSFDELKSAVQNNDLHIHREDEGDQLILTDDSVVTPDEGSRLVAVGVSGDEDGIWFALSANEFHGPGDYGPNEVEWSALSIGEAVELAKRAFNHEQYDDQPDV